MTLNERSILRRRLKRAIKEAEREYTKFQHRGLSALADDARERWALLFKAFVDAKTFDFDKEVD